MSEWRPPILGFSNSAGDIERVVWRDGTAVCGGILGDLSFEALARMRAEEARKDELRNQPNVVLLEDWRQIV